MLKVVAIFTRKVVIFLYRSGKVEERVPERSVFCLISFSDSLMTS